MPVPDFQTLMLPVLRCAEAGEMTVTECLDRLAPTLGLSNEDVSELLPSGKQTVFANHTHWAKFYLSKAGLVEMVRRGHFRITDRGRDLLARNLERIDKATLDNIQTTWLGGNEAERHQEKSFLLLPPRSKAT